MQEDYMLQHDTIAAISTPAGSGGIGIIRISGADALPILKKLFSCTKAVENIASHTITYGHIVHNEHILDEVLVSVMHAPNTYTREDVVEINCHGGILPVSQVLRAVLECGARQAEPGEFTKRAFLNGRIGLSQAEAVIDVINAKNAAALNIAQAQLRGVLSRELDIVSDKLLELLARIEVSIDYPEHDEAEVNLQYIEAEATRLIAKLGKLTASYEAGRSLREGIRTLILGRPNVGKSSLLNFLLQDDRAIVTDIPGTTRDLLSESVNIGGVPLVLTDTAGYRKTDDIVERIGVERGLDQLATAQLILLVIDGSDELSSEDEELISNISQTSGKRVLAVINKADLAQKLNTDRLTEVFPGLSRDDIITMSLKTGSGAEKLAVRITEIFNLGEISPDNDIIITNMRHEQALKNAIAALELAAGACESAMPEDIIAVELMAAASAIGEITGQTISEDMVERIFSEFCLGK